MSDVAAILHRRSVKPGCKNCCRGRGRHPWRRRSLESMRLILKR